MPRTNMSLPHERRKASLKSEELRLKVRLAETKQKLTGVRTELQAMRPKPNKDR